jgi:ABC-2 type transport system ATP-binding protein
VTAPKSAIEVKKLKKFFGDTKAVNGISFDVKKGEIFGFLGPNGAGKTTAIRCMMDFLRPDAGQISILGLDAKRNGPELKRRIGYLSGDVRLYSNWTGQEHIKFFEKFNGPSQARKLVKDLSFNVKPKFKNLSSGNRQKLGLILALMHQPELLILDEPTLGLDPILQNKIYETLHKFVAEGSTVFMSSHNLGEVERICDRVGIIKNGKIVSVDSVRALKGKKIYNITATFSKKVPKDGFDMAGVEVIKEIKNGIVLRVKGDVNPVLDKIKKFNLLDIEIIPESLEEVFLEFYR